MYEDNNEFSSIDTKKMKGLAVSLMLMHHLWAFPDRIAGGQLKCLFPIIYGMLGSFGKICVSIFFFLGGYGIYIQSTKRDFTILKNIKKLYISYWKVFIIFIPIALIFFSNQIPYCDSVNVYARFSNWNKNIVIKNFLGVSTSLNGEWWFFYSYLIAIITFPFIKEVMKNKTIVKNIFFIIIATILITYVFPKIGQVEYLGALNNSFLYSDLFCKSAPFISCFYLGILFAKENLIIKFRDLLKKNYKINFMTDIIIIITIIYLRTQVVSAELDILYVPLLVIAFTDLMNYLKIIGNIFINIGMHSTNMWLIHSFYCYYFYPVVKIVVKLKWAVPCLIVLVILTYISSCGINIFWKYIWKLYSKISKRNIINNSCNSVGYI